MLTPLHSNNRLVVRLGRMVQLASLILISISSATVCGVEAVSTEGQSVDGNAVDESGNVAGAEKDSTKTPRLAPFIGFNAIFDTNVDQAAGGATGYGVTVSAGVRYKDDRPDRLLNFLALGGVTYYISPGSMEITGRVGLDYEKRRRDRLYGLKEKLDILSKPNPSKTSPDSYTNNLELYYNYQQRKWNLKPGLKVYLGIYNPTTYNRTEVGGYLDAGYSRYFSRLNYDMVMLSDNVFSDFHRIELLGGIKESDPARRKRLDYSLGIGMVMTKDIPATASASGDMHFDFSAWLKLNYIIKEDKQQLIGELRRVLGATNISSFGTVTRATITYRYSFTKSMALDTVGQFSMEQPVSGNNTITDIGINTKFRWKPFRNRIFRHLETNIFATYFTRTAQLGAYNRITAGLGAEYTF